MYSIITKDQSAYFAGFTKTGKAKTTKIASKAWKESLQMAKVQARMLDGFQFKPVSL